MREQREALAERYAMLKKSLDQTDGEVAKLREVQKVVCIAAPVVGCVADSLVGVRCIEPGGASKFVGAKQTNSGP